MSGLRPADGGGTYAGLDIGSTAVKVVLLDEAGAEAGRALEPSGADLKSAAAAALAAAARDAGWEGPGFTRLVATGFGRIIRPDADAAKTEISCQAKASYRHVHRAHTLVDIGGQDCKIIRIDTRGVRTGFKMNRKCAAGTGAFLEEAALRLRIGLDAFDEASECSRAWRG